MAADMFQQFSLDNQEGFLEEDPVIEEVSLVRSELQALWSYAHMHGLCTRPSEPASRQMQTSQCMLVIMLYV